MSVYCVLFIFVLFYCPVLAVSKNILLHVQTAAVEVQTRIVGVKMTNGGGDRVSQWICCSCCQRDDFININYNKLLITFPAFFNVRS